MALREGELQRQFAAEWERQSKSVGIEDQLTRLHNSSAKKLVFSPTANVINTRDSEIGDDDY